MLGAIPKLLWDSMSNSRLVGSTIQSTNDENLINSVENKLIDFLSV